jgi:GNAT superfamily N-acetyltransferase
MGEVREATFDDTDALAGIAATGFFDDPVMSWVFPDATTRLKFLRTAFNGLARSFLPDAGVVHLLDGACATFWRRPGFEQHRDAPTGESPFPADCTARMDILDKAMSAVHPHTPHWYLNVISTLPAHQGKGLGARTLAAVLAVCDAEGIPAYLESSNPRNMTLYRRHGFEQAGEIILPDGPSLYPMWRSPQGASATRP